MTKQESDAVVLRSFEVSATPNLICDLAAPGHPVIRVNAALEELLGVDRSELLGRLCDDVLGQQQGFDQLDLAAPGTSVVHRALGQREPFWCQLEVRLLGDGEGVATHCLCTLRDVSEQIELRSTREYADRHDPLTGLLRGYVFEERLAAELLAAVGACSRVIVCDFAVDRMGVINEVSSFKIGDQLLRAVAERLLGVVDNPDLLCRMRSNRFAAAFVDREATADQWEIGRRLATALVEPFTIEGLPLRVTASIGVSSFPDTGSDVRELLQQAVAAVRAVKRAGGDDVQVFVPTQREVLNSRLRMATRLQGAVERRELEVHYQPIVATTKREVVGMEALVRWRSPELGLVMPDQFIPLAEDLGMIADIGRWVLHESCMQARRWLDQGVGDFTLAVNVSGLQMRDRQLLEDVSVALNAARLPPGCLDLELTETAIMSNLEQVGAMLGELRKLGVKLSLDDFGVGQSSLGHLQRLPVNRLKIDRSFVAGVPDDINATRICRAVLALAHEFNFAVVAEGVEKAVQLAFLERNGCEFVQGFFFSGAVRADAMLALLREPLLRPRELQAEGGGDSGTVLLVDDEQNVLRALTRLLRRDGYRVVTAPTFQQAFEILGSEEVQVVVSDHRMPDGKGTDFLGRVKVAHPATVRLILSGYADLGTVTDAINVGAVHRFMTKPWDDDELRDAVRDAMRLAHSGDADG